jgi:2-deoxy-D-gluconate 3-dehydrogenase
LARIQAGRWAKPEDIAGTAIWLASNAGDYVTCAAIPVDGGFSSTLF